MEVQIVECLETFVCSITLNNSLEVFCYIPNREKSPYIYSACCDLKYYFPFLNEDKDDSLNLFSFMKQFNNL